jgi:hypothetical protein
MDIRDARGHVGEYHDMEVHVIPRKEFNQLKRVIRDIIYVLVEPGKYESLMVHNMRVIGHIDPQGGVTEYDNPFEYLASEPKPKKNRVEKEVAKREEKKKEKAVRPQTKASNVPSFGTDVEGYLKWVTEDWDPITEAMGLVDLTVKIDIDIDVDISAVG